MTSSAFCVHDSSEKDLAGEICHVKRMDFGLHNAWGGVKRKVREQHNKRQRVEGHAWGVASERGEKTFRNHVNKSTLSSYLWMIIGLIHNSVSFVNFSADYGFCWLDTSLPVWLARLAIPFAYFHEMWTMLEALNRAGR